MPRSQCDVCCAPEELARSVDTYRSAVLQILCALLTETQAANAGELLGSLAGANFNSTADQAISLNSSDFYITRILVTNPSTSLTTAQGGVYDAVAKGGNPLVAASQAYTLLVNPNDAIPDTLLTYTLRHRFLQNTLYLSLTTAQGAPATADVYIFGLRLN